MNLFVRKLLFGLIVIAGTSLEVFANDAQNNQDPISIQSTLTQENLMCELATAKSDATGIGSMLGFVVAHEENMPLLHGLSQDIALRLETPEPLVLVLK